MAKPSSSAERRARGRRDAAAPERRVEGNASAGVDDPFDLADRLHSVAIHLLRRVRREDTTMGLPAPRLSALSVLVFGGPLTLSELAAAEQVRPPTMTRIVSALESDGLVEREGDPTDGRVVRVRATARGVDVLENGRRRRIEVLAQSLGALSQAERDTLAGALATIERVVGGRHWAARGAVKARGEGA